MKRLSALNVACQLSSASKLPDAYLIGHSPLHRRIFGFLVRLPPIEKVISRLTPQQLVDNHHLERHTPSRLREWGMTAKCGFWSGLSVTKLRDAGYTPTQLRTALIPWSELLPLFNLQDLHRCGMTARDGITAGLTATQLWHSGYTVMELRRGGTSWTTLLPILGDVDQLKAAGMTVAEGIAAGVDRARLRDAGYTPKQFRARGVGLSWTNLLELFDVRSLRLAGMSASEGQNANLSLSQLRDGGYSAGELCHVLLQGGSNRTQALLKKGDCVQALWKGGAKFKGYFKATVHKVGDRTASVSERKHRPSYLTPQSAQP